MTTYVLVHGAWGGAHGFHLVRPLLQDAGHRVFTPSLTGIGERAHLTSPMVGLSTHVTDVVHHVLYEDHHDIVLLGFSYGGMVVTGALAHVAERVSHLVYLDAFVPDDGDSVDALVGRGGFTPAAIGAPWLVPPGDRDFDDPAEGEWISTRRTPQPARCFSEPVRLSQPLEAYPFTRTYVKALDDPRPAGTTPPFWAAGERAKASPAWRYHEVDTNHMIPNNRPHRLAEILLELA
jgi:pimeloyl-ACP methyl ester carboxylesterase